MQMLCPVVSCWPVHPAETCGLQEHDRAKSGLQSKLLTAKLFATDFLEVLILASSMNTFAVD
jgi:hypothetical protein